MAWTYEDIIEDYNSLCTMYHDENNKDIKQNILNTLYGVKKYIMPDNTKDNIDDSIDNIYDNLFKYRQIYPVLERYYDLVNKTGFRFGHYIKRDIGIDIKLEDAYELLHEFFKSCGKEIFHYYTILEKQRDTYLDFSNMGQNYKGFIIPFPILEKVYINVPLKDRTIKDSLETLTHEYGHAVISLMNKNRYYSENSFYEIESYFFELIGLDYFYNETKDSFYINDLYNLSHAETRNVHNILSRKSAAEEAMISEKNYDKIKNICEKEIKENGTDFNKYPTYFSSDIRYSFSFLCAVELFELYKKDKDLAINTLINIATKNAKNIEEELEIINSHIKPIKSMVKHLDRIKHVTK